MNIQEIAVLKDQILKYLSDQNKKEVLSLDVYNNLKPENIPFIVMNGYMEEMVEDKVIGHFRITGGRFLFSITDKGRKFLYEGGYTKRIEGEIKIKEQEEVDNQKYRDKTDLEIKHLKASMEHYKDSKAWSIIAIIISLLTLAYTIFFKP